ncbi:MAG: glutaredoxin family protein [Vulcanococcus sp.]
MAHPPETSAALLLMTRQGCCLCEGLEEKLRALEIPLERRDVDADPELEARYGLEVPVLLAGGRELPRVSPRLGPEALRRWLQEQGAI